MKQENDLFDDSKNSNNEPLLCSNCFQDEGLKIDAFSIGIKSQDKCPNCKSKRGHKLTEYLIKELSYRFFVRGTIEKLPYGGAPLIQFNSQHFNESSIEFSHWLENDVKLLEQAGKIGFFYYGPRFWMLGKIEPLNSLQNEAERDQIIERILNLYPTKELTKDQYFYRLRLNPITPHNFSEYDTPPNEFLGENRLNDISFPVLYGSPDLELCLHECRTTVEHDVYAAKLVPSRNLKLLDLTCIIEDSLIESESLDMAIHFLFLAGKHSYNICRQIALAAKTAGFDGLMFPSYFSYIRTGHIPFDTIKGISIRQFNKLKNYAESQIVPNIALFGRPIKEKKINVECINRININRIAYDLSFGPAFNKPKEEK